MTDSFVSSRNGDLASNGVPNGSSPSLNPQSHNISVIRKKLMGYVGFANLPNQVHRKSVRKGFSFTAMVVGWSFLPALLAFSRLTCSLTIVSLHANRRVRAWKVNFDQYLVQYHSLPTQGVPASCSRTPQNRCHREYRRRWLYLST